MVEVEVVVEVVVVVVLEVVTVAVAAAYRPASSDAILRRRPVRQLDHPRHLRRARRRRARLAAARLPCDGVA